MEGAPRVRFFDACKKGISGFNDYNSRSRRSEYWFFALGVSICNIILGIILAIIQAITKNETITYIISGCFNMLIFFLFGLPLSVRRLHDIGKSGYFMFLCLIPIIGELILIYFFVQDSDREQNEYGPSPKYSNANSGFLPSETP